MTRAYAVQKLEEAVEARLFARRHAEYLRALFDRADSDTSIQLSDWLSLYGAELDNVRAALDWSFSPEGDNTLGIALTAAATLWVAFAVHRMSRANELALSNDEGADGDGQRMQLLAALGWSLMYSDSRAVKLVPNLRNPQLAGGSTKGFSAACAWGCASINSITENSAGRWSLPIVFERCGWLVRRHRHHAVAPAGRRPSLSGRPDHRVSISIESTHPYMDDREAKNLHARSRIDPIFSDPHPWLRGWPIRPGARRKEYRGRPGDGQRYLL
jgi:hypothetical protein